MPKTLPVQIGDTFSDLTYTTKLGYGQGLFTCSCGKVKEIKVSDVYHNKVSSCGCKTLEKRKASLVAKYGVDNASKAEEIKIRRAATMQARYGASHPSQCNVLIDKTKKTNRLRYGTDYAISSGKVRTKIKESLIANYGVDNPAKIEAVKQKLRQANVDNGQAILLSNGLTINQFLESNGLPFLSHAFVIRNTMGDEALYDWVKTYKDSTSSLESYFKPIANELGLKSYNKVPNEIKAIKHSYRPDFRTSDTCIDLDGLLYHSSKFKADKSYHKEKREIYTKAGLKLYQFRQDELLTKLPIVKSIIANALGNSTKVYARLTNTSKVDPKVAKKFMTTNHLMGNLCNNNAYGLYYKSELIALMSFKLKGNVLEIARFCTKQGISVLGGLSKLLSEGVRQYKPSSILSYVDLRYGTGKSLEAIGFKLKGTTLGFCWTDGYQVFHRLKCTKDSEAKVKGWYKLWDAGQAKFIKYLK